MLLVKTKVKKSKTHGLGLFADEFIPKGTITWQYHPKFDKTFSQREFNKMPALSQEFLRYYCYFDYKRKKFVLCSDSQRYINHTQNKKLENITSTPDRDIAARDIKRGEELLCDYSKFDKLYFKRMGIPLQKLK